MNSLWLMLTALAAFLVAYRLYGSFLAAKVAMLDDRRSTPSHRLNDGVDYHPTRRLVLFGYHFAAIAGPGPLIGPVLAAQWGYFPGFAWIVIGACIAGGVHDFVVLTASVRHDGLTLSNIARRNIGPVAGATTAVATLFIVIAVLASVAIVVVKALGESSWGLFTIVVTIPAALLTGVWMYKIRPGRIGEASAIGMSLVLLGVFLGKPFADSVLGPYLKLDEKTLSIILPTYAAIASILPVWVLMCPRDYLSSYMKIGVIVVLAAGIFLVQPTIQMPSTTPFLGGGGPVVAGAVWPFVCIVIMCGALSGFHALIASGTTPKMVDKESDIKVIGYGAMLLEGFVALMALIAACSLSPGDYFRMNAPQKTAEERTKYAEIMATMRTEQQWDLTPHELPTLEEDLAHGYGDPEKAKTLPWLGPMENEVKEKLGGRIAGAVTLAIGMAKVFAALPGMKQLIAYWYHFLIMFEALFILTLLETGTRVARFVFQETLAQFNPAYQAGGKVHWRMNVLMSLVVCGLWGGLLYIGNLDTLWRMLGIANQLLATIALAVGTTYLLQHAPRRVYALCTAFPFVFAATTTFTAGIQSVQIWWNQPTYSEVEQFLVKLASVLAGIMLVLSVIIVVDAIRRWYRLLFGPETRPVELAESEPA